jgi:hypothetical protein
VKRICIYLTALIGALIIVELDRLESLMAATFEKGLFLGRTATADIVRPSILHILVAALDVT